MEKEKIVKVTFKFTESERDQLRLCAEKNRMTMTEVIKLGLEKIYPELDEKYGKEVIKEFFQISKNFE